MNTAVAHLSPFDARWTTHVDYQPGDTLHLIASRAIAALEAQTGLPGGFGWFMAHGLVRVNGVAVDRDWWPHVRPKPGMFVDMFCLLYTSDAADE